MVLFENYTTDDLIMNLPFEHIEIGDMYPVLLRDFKEFGKVLPLLKINKEILEMPNVELSVLGITILGFTQMYINELGIEFEAAYNITLENMKTLIKFVTKKDFEIGSIGDEVAFICEEGDRTFEISESNFEQFKEIVLKQNVIVEEKEYKDKVVNKWLKKARNARNKDGGIEFSEMVAIVKNHTCTTYHELMKQNIFQLYLDFKTVVLNKSYDTSMLFKTVSDKVESVDYTKLNIEEMFEVKEYVMSANSVFSKLS